MFAKRKKPGKMVALLLAVVLMFGCAVGGTLAWLMDNTDPVVNTFSPSNIDIILTETYNIDTDGNGIADKWQQKMVPGAVYTKNPVVSVDDSTDVDCYLFVRFVEEGNPGTYLTYTSTLTTANGWKQVPGETNVWYRIVMTGDNVKSWHLLEDDKITVKDTVTKENMDSASGAKLTYEAYAIQYLGFEDESKVAETWAQAYAQKNSN